MMPGKWRQANPTTLPGRCIWCGYKLRRESHHSAAAHNREAALGDYGDGVFCGLRCGYQFGQAFAGFGRRLNPWKPKA